MSACQGCQGTPVRTKHVEVDRAATEAEIETVSWIWGGGSLSFKEMSCTTSKMSESLRGWTGRGSSLPSEKLNQPSECGQSEYKRDEITVPIPTPNLPHFSVTLIDVLEALGREVSSEILLQNVSGSKACSAVPN